MGGGTSKQNAAQNTPNDQFPTILDRSWLPPLSFGHMMSSSCVSTVCTASSTCFTHSRCLLALHPLVSSLSRARLNTHCAFVRMQKLEEKLDLSLKIQESKDAKIADLSSTLASMKTPQKAAFSSSPAKLVAADGEGTHGTAGRTLSAVAADHEAQMEALQEELERIKQKLEEEECAHAKTKKVSQSLVDSLECGEEKLKAKVEELEEKLEEEKFSHIQVCRRVCSHFSP